MKASSLELFARTTDIGPKLLQRVEVSQSAALNYVTAISRLILQLRQDISDSGMIRELWMARDRVLLSLNEYDEGSIVGPLARLGTTASVAAQWGDNTAHQFRQAVDAGVRLIEGPNYLRSQVRELLEGSLAENHADVRMFCHRADRPDEGFLESVGSCTSSFDLLHTLPEYARSEPFDVLLKVGPLRAMGRGKLPDAVLIAPKFAHLIQVVLAGVSDETDYPYEPIDRNRSRWSEIAGPPEGRSRMVLSSGLEWVRETIRIGDSDMGAIDIDDRQLFASQPYNDSPDTELCDAVLLALGDDLAVLLPQQADEMVWSPDLVDGQAVAMRSLSGQVHPGMWWVRREVSAPELSLLKARDGQRSKRWKLVLAAILGNRPVPLEQTLRRHGISVQDLQTRMREWCKSAGTVIAAPQSRSDFAILMNVLEPWVDDPQGVGVPSRRWVSEAWSEVARSRSAATTTGMVEHDLVDQELLVLLNATLTRSDAGMSKAPPIRVNMEAGGLLEGYVDLYPIQAVERGYACLRSRVRQIITLEEAAQWQG